MHAEVALVIGDITAVRPFSSPSITGSELNFDCLQPALLDFGHISPTQQKSKKYP
jgi:hypothetical protein